MNIDLSQIKAMNNILFTFICQKYRKNWSHIAVKILQIIKKH